MELKRDSCGFIDITNLKKLDKNWFEYRGIKYYFKECSDYGQVYYELIAEEIAKDYKIPCAHYDLAIYNDKKGVISENFLKDKNKNKYLGDILNYYESFDNNLEDIWNVLCLKYKNNEIVFKLMQQLVNIFIFDVLIANGDRNSSNLIIVEEENDANFSCIFDNEMMLDSMSIDYGDYSLKIGSSTDKGNMLERFIKLSDNSYIEILKNKLWIISQENIKSILNRVENKINSSIPSDIKDKVLSYFSENLCMINDFLEKNNNRKLG